MFVKIGLGIKLICMFWQGLLGAPSIFFQHARRSIYYLQLPTDDRSSLLNDQNHVLKVPDSIGPPKPKLFVSWERKLEVMQTACEVHMKGNLVLFRTHVKAEDDVASPAPYTVPAQLFTPVTFFQTTFGVALEVLKRPTFLRTLQCHNRLHASLVITSRLNIGKNNVTAPWLNTRILVTSIICKTRVFWRQTNNPWGHGGVSGNLVTENSRAWKPHIKHQCERKAQAIRSRCRQDLTVIDYFL